MSVIKAPSVAAHLLRFDAATGAAARGAAEASSPLMRALDDARAEIAELQAALSAARDETAAAVAAARHAGEAAGRTAMSEVADARLDLLRASLVVAEAKWRDRLAGLDALAVMVARAALDKLFGEGGPGGNVTARQIVRAIETVGARSVIAIRVSTDDFADDDALGALAAAVRPGAAELIADPVLASGECRFDLTLGHVDIGARTQWRALESVLSDMVAEQAGAA